MLKYKIGDEVRTRIFHSRVIIIGVYSGTGEPYYIIKYINPPEMGNDVSFTHWTDEDFCNKLCDVCEYRFRCYTT